MHTKAWTGGSMPQPLSKIGLDERVTLRRLFQDALHTYSAHWGGLPDRDTMRILWRRARADAHATHR